MKKPTCISVISLTFILLIATQGKAQDFRNLDISPLDVVAFPVSHKKPNKLVKVVYSRPQLKGRKLSDLVPNDVVWRTGANEAANIILYKAMSIGGQTVAAGEYSLFTIPGKKAWTIILSKDINVWGAYYYKKENDVTRVSVPVTTGKRSLEAFSIAFTKDGTMHLGWDTLRVALPITEIK